MAPRCGAATVKQPRAGSKASTAVAKGIKQPTKPASIQTRSAAKRTASSPCSTPVAKPFDENKPMQSLVQVKQEQPAPPPVVTVARNVLQQLKNITITLEPPPYRGSPPHVLHPRILESSFDDAPHAYVEHGVSSLSLWDSLNAELPTTSASIAPNLLPLSDSIAIGPSMLEQSDNTANITDASPYVLEQANTNLSSFVVCAGTHVLIVDAIQLNVIYIHIPSSAGATFVMTLVQVRCHVF